MGHNALQLRDVFMGRVTQSLWLVGCLLLWTGPQFAQNQLNKPLMGYQTVVIEKVTVENGLTAKEFPSGYEVTIHKRIVARLSSQKLFSKVINSAETTDVLPEGKSLVLVTQIIRFDKGNRFVRSAFGPGPGAAKIKVRFILKDASSGQEILKIERQGKAAPKNNLSKF